ncbi:DEDD [Branchiostoma lanceolatum]|uniref:DEDD protein n=1 Tax=Branchiostoma lanceolatum TaxID=7740 RepID=A0A8J9ZZ28_BRALA|nr:DEDD [Branchiostoma lanceolatum]
MNAGLQKSRRMEPVETIEDLIRNNYVLLRERLQVEKLIPHFIERRLLDFSDRQVVMSKTTILDKADALLELLTKKGSCKPEGFLEILKKGDHQHVADQLKRTSSQKEITEGASSARLGDNSTGTQGSEGSLGSSSDEESLQESFRLLRISEKIFEVLNDTEKLESWLLCFRQHVDDTMHFCKLSCKAKLRVERKVRRHARKIHKVVFSPLERELEQYDKIAKCFRLYSATLKKIEDGCVLCTLEFDDVPHLKSFLRGYRDGKLSETLTQELITEEMKQEGGPDLYVHVTLLVAKGSVGPDDEGSALEKTQHMPEDKEVQKTFPAFKPDSATPGLKKSISKSMDDIHAMQLQTHPVQKGTPQPDLCSLDLATTFVQDSRVKDWASDSLTNHLALRLAVKSRQLQESERKVKSTIELHSNKVEEQASVMLRLSAVVRELTHKLETAEKILSDKNSEIQQQKEAIKNLTAINEDLQAQNTKLAANVESKETREQASVKKKSKLLSDKNSEIQQQEEAIKNLTAVIEDLQAENTKLAAKAEGKETREHDLEVVPSSADVSGGGQSDEFTSDEAPTVHTQEGLLQTDPEAPAQQKATSPVLEQTGHGMEDISASEEVPTTNPPQESMQTDAEVPSDVSPNSDPQTGFHLEVTGTPADLYIRQRIQHTAQENLSDVQPPRSFDYETKDWITENCPDWNNREIKKTYMVPATFPDIPIKRDDIRGELAEKHVYDILEKFGNVTEQPMFVVHSYKFQELLDKETSQRKEVPHWLRGEHDFVIIHRTLGVILFEVIAGTTARQYIAATKQIDKNLMSLNCAVKRLSLKEDPRADEKKIEEEMMKYPGFVVMPNCSRQVAGNRKGCFKEDIQTVNAFQKWWDKNILREGEMTQAMYELMAIRFVGPLVTSCLRKVVLDTTHKRLIQLRKEQLSIFTEDVPKQYFMGPAGSGKTRLLVEKAKQVAVELKANERILIMCYNKPLSLYLASEFRQFPNVFVKTFVSLLLDVKGEATNLDTLSGEEEKKKIVLDCVQKLTSMPQSSHRYEHVFVDEGQDMFGIWWELIDLLHADSDEERRYKWVFFDNNQNVTMGPKMNITSGMKEDATPMNRIVRNTYNIFDCSQKLLSPSVGAKIAHGVTGPQVEWIDTLPTGSVSQCLQEGAEVLRKKIGELASEHVAMSDIVVLTRDKAKSEEVCEYLSSGSPGIPTQNAEKAIECSDSSKITVDSIRRFKGLEGKVVILLDPPFDDEMNMELNYVGMSRCFCLLIIITSKEKKQKYEEFTLEC